MVARTAEPVAEPQVAAAMARVASTAPHVFQAMSAVMEDIGKIGIAKGRKNKDQGYSFRGIDDVHAALNPLLAKHRLLMIPTKIVASYEDKAARSGSELHYVRMTVDWTLASAMDGSTTPMQTVGEAMDSSDKASNKAQSAAMKYAAIMVFVIPTEGLDDADAETPEADAKGARPPSKAALTRDELMTLAKTSIDACDHERDLLNWEQDHAHTFETLNDADFKAVGAMFRARRKLITQQQQESVS